MDNYKNGLLYRWTTDFVGSSWSFKVILVAIILGGFCFSFRLFAEPYSSYLLLVFGVVIPILLTLCLYNTLMHCNLLFSDSQLFSIFQNRKLNYTLRSVDCLLILVLAGLISFDILNYFVFRFIQTLIIPVLFVVVLRLIYTMSDGNDENSVTLE